MPIRNKEAPSGSLVGTEETVAAAEVAEGSMSEAGSEPPSPPPASPHPGGSGPVHTWGHGCTCPGCMSKPPPLTWGIIQTRTPYGGEYPPANTRGSLANQIYLALHGVPLPGVQQAGQAVPSVVRRLF